MIIILLAFLISGLQPSVDRYPVPVKVKNLSGTASLSQATELTTMIFVRHAETEEIPGDVDLNEEGRKRAERLALHLEKTEITAVYSTPYNRTRQTAEAVAGANDLTVQEYDPRNPVAIEEIVEDNVGGVVLVTGHSNTTPGLVNRLLGEQRFEQLEESDYGNIFVVTLHEGAPTHVLHLRY